MVREYILTDWYKKIIHNIDTKSQTIIWKIPNNVKDSFMEGNRNIDRRHLTELNIAVRKSPDKTIYELTAFTLDHIVGDNGDFEDLIIYFCKHSLIYNIPIIHHYMNFDEAMDNIMTDEYLHKKIDNYFDKQYRKLVNGVDMIGAMA